MITSGKYNHVSLITLIMTGMFVYLPCFAQSQTDLLKNQNLSYWSVRDQSRREHFSRQQFDFNYIFRSRVIDDDSSDPVRDCHIINNTQRTATVSDINGDFKITANINDSITFSAVGYETLTIILTESMYDYGLMIRLNPKTYQLEEVTIKPFIEQPTITRWEIYTTPLPNQGGINIPTGIHPVTALYNLFSSEGKQQRYYQKLMDETHDFMIIGEKFNGEMVAQITGLKDDELVRFMSWCNFSHDFLRNYSPETIKRAIRTKYQEYREGNI